MKAELALEVHSLSKTLAGRRIIHDIDLRIVAGEVHALVGENGSGKSTLIKVLSGYHDPDAGSVVRIGGHEVRMGGTESRSAGARFVHQDLGLVDSCTVSDNLSFLSGFQTRLWTVQSKRSRTEARQWLSLVGLAIDPDTLVAQLSPSERVGVAVARALRGEEGRPATLLVLDEPTASLSAAEVRMLLRIVRAVAASGAGVLYVTHRIEEVFEVATTVTVLRDGRRVASRPTSGLTRSELVRLMLGDGVDQANLGRTDTPAREPAGAPALAVQMLSAGPLRSVTMAMQPGEIVGIAGITGSGRETLLSALFGATFRDAGTVRVGSQAVPAGRPAAAIAAGMGFVPADRRTRGAMMALSARENLTLCDLAPFWRPPIFRFRSELAEARSWFERLSIRPNCPENPFDSFSGGNQQKVMIAKWLRTSPKVLLLDEPTQGVDIGARVTVHGEITAAADRGTAVLVSSSDSDELAAICNRVLVLGGGTIAATLAGEQLKATTISQYVVESTGVHQYA